MVAAFSTRAVLIITSFVCSFNEISANVSTLHMNLKFPCGKREGNPTIIGDIDEEAVWNVMIRHMKDDIDQTTKHIKQLMIEEETYTCYKESREPIKSLNVINDLSQKTTLREASLEAYRDLRNILAHFNIIHLRECNKDKLNKKLDEYLENMRNHMIPVLCSMDLLLKDEAEELLSHVMNLKVIAINQECSYKKKVACSLLNHVQELAHGLAEFDVSKRQVQQEMPEEEEGSEAVDVIDEILNLEEALENSMHPTVEDMIDEILNMTEALEATDKHKVFNSMPTTALGEDSLPVKEDAVPLGDDLKALAAMQKRDLGILSSRQETVYPPGTYKLNFGDSGVFTSPGFPADYQNNEKAKWIFRCIGGVIETSCFTRIRTSPGCKLDKLALFRGKGFNEGVRFCGRNDRLLGFFKDRLKAVFTTNASIVNKGFECSFTCDEED